MQLSDKHLRILGILQSRKREFEDAAQYTLTTLKNRPQAGELITKLDSIGQLVTKVLSGNLPTAEEIKEVKPISGELILGYNEKTRIASKCSLMKWSWSNVIVLSRIQRSVQ